MKFLLAFFATIVMTFGYAAPQGRDLKAPDTIKKFECIPMKFHFKDGGYKELTDEEIKSIGGVAFEINETKRTGHDLKGNPLKYKMSVDGNNGVSDIYGGDGFDFVIKRSIEPGYRSVGFVIHKLPGW